MLDAYLEYDGSKNSGRRLRSPGSARRRCVLGQGTLTKVDRSGAYATRHAARNVVASGLDDRCEVQLAYVIGRARPLVVNVQDFGTSQLGEDELTRRVREEFDFRPEAVIERLRPREPRFQKTACYGHFGRDPVEGFTWERTDRTDRLG